MVMFSGLLPKILGRGLNNQMVGQPTNIRPIVDSPDMWGGPRGRPTAAGGPFSLFGGGNTPRAMPEIGGGGGYGRNGQWYRPDMGRSYAPGGMGHGGGLAGLIQSLINRGGGMQNQMMAPRREAAPVVFPETFGNTGGSDTSWALGGADPFSALFGGILGDLSGGGFGGGGFGGGFGNPFMDFSPPWDDKGNMIADKATKAPARTPSRRRRGRVVGRVGFI